MINHTINFITLIAGKINFEKKDFECRMKSSGSNISLKEH